MLGSQCLFLPSQQFDCTSTRIGCKNDGKWLLGAGPLSSSQTCSSKSAVATSSASYLRPLLTWLHGPQGPWGRHGDHLGPQGPMSTMGPVWGGFGMEQAPHGPHGMATQGLWNKGMATKELWTKGWPHRDRALGPVNPRAWDNWTRAWDQWIQGS